DEGGVMAVSIWVCLKYHSQFSNGTFSRFLTRRSHMAAIRSFLYFAFATLCSLSCNASATGKTRIFYSAYFSGYVPTVSLEEATFFASYAGGWASGFRPQSTSPGQSSPTNWKISMRTSTLLDRKTVV